MEALYFPFLRFRTGRIKKIQSCFSKLFLLSLPELEDNSGERTEKLYPPNLDPFFLKTVSRMLEEKITLSGSEALDFLFSEKKEALPSLSSLVANIAEKDGNEKEDENSLREMEGLHLAALILTRAEDLDLLNEELEREFLDIEKTRESLLFELTGEEKNEKREEREDFPEHLEIRVKAFFKILCDCGNVPGIWVTDMPDAERILEKNFPEAENKTLPLEFGALEAALDGDQERLFLEVPLNAQRLSGISFSPGTWSLKILCI